MPLAFDLTSTLVMGSTFPVATTLFARSPFSTFWSLVGSILVPPRVAATTPPTIRRTLPMTTEIQINRLRRFFALLLPFTSASGHSVLCRSRYVHPDAMVPCFCVEVYQHRLFCHCLRPASVQNGSRKVIYRRYGTMVR